MSATNQTAIICVDRNVPGPGCGWQVYTPVAFGTFGHKEAHYSRDLDEAKAWCASKGYEFEVRS